MSYEDNLPLREILPEAIRSRLSTEAGTLYEIVWNSMHFKGVSELKLSDDVASKRTRITVGALQTAKAELESLLLFTLGKDGNRVTYRYLQPA
jgi:hypothetical protein